MSCALLSIPEGRLMDTVTGQWSKQWRRSCDGGFALAFRRYTPVAQGVECSLRLALKPRIPSDLRWRKDTRHFPNRESGRFQPKSCPQRILSCVLPEPKPAISRGDLDKV